MNTHVCDGSLLRGPHNPLTRARTLRLVQARFDSDTDTDAAVAQVLAEVEGCRLCACAMLVTAARFIGEFATLESGNAGVAQLDEAIANALDDTRTSSTLLPTVDPRPELIQWSQHLRLHAAEALTRAESARTRSAALAAQTSEHPTATHDQPTAPPESARKL